MLIKDILTILSFTQDNFRQKYLAKIVELFIAASSVTFRIQIKICRSSRRRSIVEDRSVFKNNYNI